MNEIVQQQGIRKWRADDWLNMQSTYLRLIEDFYRQYGNFVYEGCILANGTITAGIVMLDGKACPFAGAKGVTDALHVRLAREEESVEYEITGMQTGFINFFAEVCNASDEGAFRLDDAPRFRDVILSDGGITSSKLASNAVTVDKVADGAITASKIANSAVTGNKLASNAVTVDKVVDGAISNSKIAANAVTTDKIANGAITTSKIANRTITGDKIAEQTITTNNIEDDAVLNNKAGFPTIIAAGNVFFDSSTYPNIRRSNKGALCYVTRLSAGQYSLSFNPDSTGFMIVSAANAADYIVRAIGMSSPFTVIMKNLTGGYVDVEFNFCLIRM